MPSVLGHGAQIPRPQGTVCALKFQSAGEVAIGRRECGRRARIREDRRHLVA
jgi:hypothetical protein